MAEAADTDSIEVGEEAFRKLCTHYSRGCSLVSPCCGRVYPCRLCHNEQELSHEINRQAVTEVECRRCHTRQSVTNTCCKCQLKFGVYFCDVCRLYDDTDKGQFHCDGCGLCRVGGRQNMFHCSKCCLCLPHSMRDNHACREAAAKDNCPVCFEDIHGSRDPAHIPPCGHLLHSACYTKLLEKGIYQCPQCQTSLQSMGHYWQQMDNERDLWVLPQHLKDFKVKVLCRDCHKEGDTDYHIIGLKCPTCGSYNTVRSGNEEIPSDGSITRLLDQMQQHRIQRRRQRRRRRSRDGETNSSTESDSDDEEDNHGNHQHRSESEDGEDPGNQSQLPHPQENNSRSSGSRGNNRSNDGENPPSSRPNEDNSRSYDGDASENDDNEETSSDCDSDVDYYEAQRSRTYISFARRGYTTFLSPIEVPVGTEPGALEWWQDPNDSEQEHQRRTRPLSAHAVLGIQREQNRHGHHIRVENRPISEALNSPTEIRRRAIAESIVRNMRLWNSDSESFSELSSEEELEEEEEEKSSDSWVTEEEEVIIGMGGSDLQQEEAELDDNCYYNDDVNHHRGIPKCEVTTVFGQNHSESGVESAESWFTSSDNSHTQLGHNELDKRAGEQLSPPDKVTALSCTTSTIAQHVNLGETQQQRERGSFCSSISTDDSLAWETAYEDLSLNI